MELLIGDLMIYICLVSNSLNIDLSSAVKSAFNNKSEEINSNITIPNGYIGVNKNEEQE